MKLLSGLLFSSTLFLAACATTQPDIVKPDRNTPPELAAIENLNAEAPGEGGSSVYAANAGQSEEVGGLQVASGTNQVNYIRTDSVRETGMSLGARTALAYRGRQINQLLNNETDTLNEIFNFRPLLLENSVLPPVLLESRESLDLASPHMLRLSDRSYRILKQARFVTAAPTWQDYLWMDESKPEGPDESLLPKTEEEVAIWREAARQGWAAGLKQADSIYEENLNRLKRDYQGMIRYRLLLAQRMVSAPQVARRELGVTGGGEELSVNSRLLTIQALPSLKADSATWVPAISP